MLWTLLWGEPMDELVNKIKERINSGQYQGETAVREAIVLPILQALGWDIFDPNFVIRECALGNRRVDYALTSAPPRRQIFVEVKAIGLASGADRQLFEYAFHEGIPFAVLTDGREWNFFLPGEQGSYEERRVQKLDLSERSPSDASQIFRKYLDFARVRSGEAIESARADYKSISKRKIAANEIPKAWSELISEPDELLIDLIAEKAESLCGFRPAPEDVEAFLVAMPNGIAPTIRTATTTTPRDVKPAPAENQQPISERGISYKMLGQNRHAHNAIEALIEILKTFANRNPSFLEKVSATVRGRTRNHIARSRDDVYPRKPELTEYTTEIAPGWWLGTNIANRDKMRIIAKACQVEGLTLGRDIIIKLPNAE
jgi:predicted type IV restriction endonuclease/negative regulator of replication initiation